MSEPSEFEATLRARAGAVCELCSATDGLTVHELPPAAEPSPDHCVLLCPTCLSQIDRSAPLDPKHWFCLQQAAWSEVPAVQVIAYRLLSRLSEEGWARDLLDQVYLADETLEWARAGLDTDAGQASDPPGSRTVDSNGTELADGDSVTLIKDLDVKGAGFTAKRGTLVKGIRLTDNPEHVEGRVNKVSIVLKTCFLKKAV
ncbi:Alkylphosphonate utilization operon protein PhnA [Enhygromyxa salina]|uniref:Alkylphosphonate utilization operon protein PhnA n=1 Tax=Enhygromyxa salina TaxID=215803 RepID=A0A0C1ZXG9_9BACT|nr:alkylphosphonate utilization protein [Enhygromyxa salina]KIG15808.1 Alkylphosphonate utilization operon protein PhnA [Enhygromyxa salina]